MSNDRQVYTIESFEITIIHCTMYIETKTYVKQQLKTNLGILQIFYFTTHARIINTQTSSTSVSTWLIDHSSPIRHLFY